MFPDLDADVIEAVLRANNGAVDITIDHLLTMTADNEAAKFAEQSDDKPPEYTGINGHMHLGGLRGSLVGPKGSSLRES